MIGQVIAFPLNSVGDLVMAIGAIVMGVWIYRNGPQSNRVMLRYWVLAFVTLCIAGLLGAVLEGIGSSMTHSEIMNSRLGLAALYMAAGLFQLFAVLEVTHHGSWGKDLFMGGSGAAYLIIIVIALIYKFPDAKMLFLTYSSTISVGAILLVGPALYAKFKWLLLAAFIQLAGVVIYYLQFSFLGISYSLLFNLLMFAGMVFYLRGLKEIKRDGEHRPGIQTKKETNATLSEIV